MKKRIEVLFEHTTDGIVWRGVKDTDGAYRVDRRGLSSKTFRPAMWTGGIEGLDKYREGGEMVKDRKDLRNYRKSNS